MNNDIKDEDVVLFLELKVRRSGAMSIAGCVDDEHNALAMLDSARETIVNRAMRKKLHSGLIVPSSELNGVM